MKILAFTWISRTIVTFMLLWSAGNCGISAHASEKLPASPDASTDTARALPSEQASQADAFVDSIGIVTHLSYNNTPYYTDWPRILNSLKAFGIRHIRDGFYDWGEDSPYIAEHKELATAGIKCDYVVPYDATTTPEIIEQFASEVRDMESLEAPNECDVSGNCGGGSGNGLANMLGFMPTIDAAGKHLRVPVFGPSFTQQVSYVSVGNISSLMTFNNLHIYFGGRNPGSEGWGAPDAQGHAYGSFAWWLDQANIDAPKVPSVATETGYMSFPETSTPFTLPESVEASYTPRTLMLAFKAGIRRTFLYELLDEQSSPAYGLLNNDLSAKAAYTAVRNLILVLKDEGKAFSPATLSYSVDGGSPTLNHLLLEKRDGTFYLILWLEESSYDPVAAAPIPITPQTVTLRLGASQAARQVLKFNDEGSVSARNVNAGTLRLTISDQISIVRVVPMKVKAASEDDDPRESRSSSDL